MKYNDGDTESLSLQEESWRYSNVLSSSSVYTAKNLESNRKKMLSNMFEALENKSFIFRHAQGFEQAVISNAHDVEECEFL